MWERQPAIGHLSNYSSIRRLRREEYKIYVTQFGTWLYTLTHPLSHYAKTKQSALIRGIEKAVTGPETA